MRKLYLTGALAAAALALAACGQESNTAAPAANDADAAGEADAGDDGEANSAGEDGAPQAQAGAQQDFTIVNTTGRTVMTLQVSPNDSDQWGPDILGTETIADGASGQVTFARGQEQCLWDLRATFDDGRIGDWRGVNLCEAATVTLTPVEGE